MPPSTFSSEFSTSGVSKTSAISADPSDKIFSLHVRGSALVLDDKLDVGDDVERMSVPPNLETGPIIPIEPEMLGFLFGFADVACSAPPAPTENVDDKKDPTLETDAVELGVLPDFLGMPPELSSFPNDILIRSETLLLPELMALLSPLVTTLLDDFLYGSGLGSAKSFSRSSLRWRVLVLRSVKEVDADNVAGSENERFESFARNAKLSCCIRRL
ncbi:hypothetical protein BC829DRAFT_441120 [Chytridium lagenaria]|nr:hypothetical protein BC829DRAFT_441120 [Chytridium lagenaria]